MSDAIVVRNVRKRIGKSRILKGVSFNLPSRGLVGISGPSGCGKSTLLNILSGIDPYYAGSVILLGQAMSSLQEDMASSLRLQSVGFVQQSFGLLEFDSVENNVTLPMESMFCDGEKAFHRRAIELLSFVGMDGKARARVNTLSGGEKQRVAIARSLANDPKIVFADEPTGSLDEANSETIFELLKSASLDRLIVVVSHDEESLRKYADRILFMKDGEIIATEDYANEPKGKFPLCLRLVMPKLAPSVPGSILYRHAKMMMKAKRVRNYLCSSLICAGLVGLGLALYIHSSIQSEISGALAGFIKDTSLVVEPVNQRSSPLGAISAASIEQAESLLHSYRDYISGYGVTLLTDYDAVFCDENSFYLPRTTKENYRLEEFSARSINDFLWLEPDMEIYPEMPKRMNLTDVVLGLPYQNMYKICFEMGLERAYDALGRHIADKGLSMIVDLANSSAQFFNDDLFDIVGIVPSDVPCLYHLDQLWNKHYFVGHLNFHTVNSSRLENMQQMFEVPYISCTKGLYEVVDRARSTDIFSSLIFEPFQDSYLPSLEDEMHPLKLDRTYLYEAEKYGINFKNMADLKAFCPKIRGFMPISTQGYFASTSSLLSGFPGSFFICKNPDLAFEVSERCAVMKAEEANLPLALPTGIISGAMQDGSSSFWVVSGESHFISGKGPSSPSEVCLSSSLYQKWGSPSEIYVAAEISSEEIDGVLLRDFSFSTLKVTGVKEESKDVIYATSYWTYDFFLCNLGCSGFSLEPNGAVLDFSSKAEASAAYASLVSRFPEYRFFNPSSEVDSTASDVTGYIGIVLIAFSAFALIMAGMLFLVVMSLTLEESGKELGILYRLGIKQKDRARSMRMHVLSYCLQSVIPSLLALVALEVAVHFFICHMFGTSHAFPIAWVPFVAIIGATLLLYFFFSLVIELRFKKKK